MNKLKNFLPCNILQTIYCSLILPRFNYCLLAWGHKARRLTKLQKKAIRIINHSNYNAHTDPIFKSRHLLKLEDIYKLQALKFYYKFVNNRLPVYSSKFQLMSTNQIHDHDTRRQQLFVTHTQHVFAKKCTRHEVIRIVNEMPLVITGKVHTHSLSGFSYYIKKTFISNYQETCTTQNCYICR